MKIRKHPINYFEGIAWIDENAGPSAARLQYSIFKFAAYRFQSPRFVVPTAKTRCPFSLVWLIRSAVSCDKE